MNPLQELTQKIHKYCPELMELSFGCQVEMDRGGFATVLWKRDTTSSFIRLHNKKTGHNYNKTRWAPNEGLRILGHPITLEHVLKAIRYGTNHFLAIRDDGVFITLPKTTQPDRWLPVVHGKDNSRFVQWIIGKPFSSQPLETIEWLNKIIV